MILVACGTHHQPFDRLVAAAEAVAGAGLGPVVLQRGASGLAAPGCEVHDIVPPQRFARWLRDARIVVLHGGSSSFLEAREAGRTPIIVPRRPEYGEHVDDHQVRFVDSVAHAVRVAEPDILVEVVRTFSEPGRPSESPRPGFRERFAALVRAWHSDTDPPRR